MAKTLKVHDPYRNIDTTLSEFAKAEGVPKYPVSHYFWWHRTLEGFRSRPAKGTGNGIKPHTYTLNGEFITLREATRIARMDVGDLKKYREKYKTNDVVTIRRHRDAYLKKLRQKRLIVTEDGRKMTATEYAKEQGVTLSAITSWLYRKGTLKGFTNRGGSRVNPPLYHHSGLGESKPIKEWAKYFKCSIRTIRLWLRKHNFDINGFKVRKMRRHTMVGTCNGK